MNERTLSNTSQSANSRLLLNGFIVWFTGLSGSGKSTLAALLARELALRGIDYELLDGDEARTSLCRDLGFTPEHRNENVRRLSYVANLLCKHGVVTIVAAISPYRQAREEARKSNARFFEVHVDCPLPTLIERDVKGLYRLALEGRIPNFTGISDPYEAPITPELRLRTDHQSKEQCVALILNKLECLAWLPFGTQESKDDFMDSFSLEQASY